MKKTDIKLFDLFCGGGGSSWGAFMLGIDPIAALDKWDIAASTYSLNFRNAKVFCTEAGSISLNYIAKEIGRIDLLIASPECTNHSLARGNKPQCERSKETAFEVIRFARFFKPRWLVVENVEQMRKWKRFEEWKRELEKIGYKIKINILDSIFFNVPQTRRRLFIIGDSEEFPEFPSQQKKTDIKIKDIINYREPAKGWNFTQLVTPNRSVKTLKRAQKAIMELGDTKPFLLVYYGMGKGYLDLNQPFRTITTHDRFAYVVPTENGHKIRMLQPEELAKAMGFPDEHRWATINKQEKVKIIGNAVCPPVMRSVLEKLING
ncbi:MAG: DNA cytosine methyltransferase [Candidatus Coatesbacteria bacterium]|nr:DNA cytosine methyltransferase [Candidatus Coatesbacteria bacterium]